MFVTRNFGQFILTTHNMIINLSIVINRWKDNYKSCRQVDKYIRATWLRLVFWIFFKTKLNLIKLHWNTVYTVLKIIYMYFGESISV